MASYTGALYQHASPDLWVKAWAVLGFWGVVVGTVVAGSAQWLVLRKHTRRSGWWVLASTVGWTTSGVVSRTRAWNADEVSAWTVAASGVVDSAVAGAVAGAITGYVLALLLRYPIEERSEAEA